MFRSLARPLLASWFIYDGVQTALEPEPRAKTADLILAPVYEEYQLATAPPTEDIVRAHAIATVGAATVLAFSRTPRSAGVALAALAAAQWAFAPRPWTMAPGPERDAAIENFIKTGALVGGALLASSVGHADGHNRRKKARRAKAKARAKSQARSTSGSSSLRLW
jgi:putative oxidoreductase